jgi:hypothetical protein
MPRESQRPRGRPAADRTGPSQFHDVDSGEDVDDLRRRGRLIMLRVGIVAGAVTGAVAGWPILAVRESV